MSYITTIVFRARSRAKAQQKHKTNSEFWLHNHSCLLIMARFSKVHGRSVPVRRSFFAFCPRKTDKVVGWCRGRARVTGCTPIACPTSPFFVDIFALALIYARPVRRKTSSCGSACYPEYRDIEISNTVITTK